GPIADAVAGEIRAALTAAGAGPARVAATAPTQIAPMPMGVASSPLAAQALLAGLGGRAHVLKIEACSTRRRVTVARPQAVDADRLHQVGARGVAIPKPASVHVLVGPAAAKVADDLRALQTAA